eukprot:g19895.t1
MASRWLHDGSRWLDDGFTMALSWLHDGFTMASRWLHDGFTVASRWLHDGFTMAHNGWSSVGLSSTTLAGKPSLSRELVMWDELDVWVWDELFMFLLSL